DVVVVLQRLQEHAERRHRRARRQAQDLGGARDVGAAQAGGQAGERRGGEQDRVGGVVGLAAAEQQRRVAVGAQRVGGAAAVERRAQLARLVERHLEDGGLDEHLAARHVELPDDVAQRVVVLAVGDDHQRVGGLVGGHLDVALEQADAAAGLRAGGGGAAGG